MKKILLPAPPPADTITLGQTDRSKAIFAKLDGKFVGMLLPAKDGFCIQVGFSTSHHLPGLGLKEAMQGFEAAGYEFFQEA